MAPHWLQYWISKTKWRAAWWYSDIISEMAIRQLANIRKVKNYVIYLLRLCILLIKPGNRSVRYFSSLSSLNFEKWLLGILDSSQAFFEHNLTTATNARPHTRSHTTPPLCLSLFLSFYLSLFLSFSIVSLSVSISLLPYPLRVQVGVWVGGSLVSSGCLV